MDIVLTRGVGLAKALKTKDFKGPSFIPKDFRISEDVFSSNAPAPGPIAQPKPKIDKGHMPLFL